MNYVKSKETFLCRLIRKLGINFVPNNLFV